MSIVSHLFNASATKLTSKTNKFGEVVLSPGSTAYPCRFRETGGDTLEHNPNRDQINSDAQAWFDPGTPIAVGDIVSIDSEHWRVQTVQECRGAASTVEFLKMFLERYRQVT